METHIMSVNVTESQDYISAIQTQRNGAANDAAQYYALWQQAVREVTALKEKYEPKPELKAVEK